MVVTIIQGDTIDEGTCRHCGRPIQLWKPWTVDGDGEPYWFHPTGPTEPNCDFNSSGCSIWCRTQVATP